MKDFLKLKKLITPIIPILFWTGVIICILAGIALINIGFGSEDHIDAINMTFLGIGCLIFGPIALRLFCELLIILFAIHDTLADIKKQLKPSEE